MQHILEYIQKRNIKTTGNSIQELIKLISDNSKLELDDQLHEINKTDNWYKGILNNTLEKTFLIDENKWESDEFRNLICQLFKTICEEHNLEFKESTVLVHKKQGINYIGFDKIGIGKLTLTFNYTKPDIFMIEIIIRESFKNEIFKK